MSYPGNYRYTKDHEWIESKGAVATIGITDYAQHLLGDIVFVELPKLGAILSSGQSLGTVESVKAVSEIYAPASGEVVEVNPALHDGPEKLNSDPHGAAWLVRVKVSSPSEVDALMDAAAYEAYISASEKASS